jgi:hypothetical protein
MLNDPLFGFLAFACALVINRVLAEKALKQLSSEEKVKLLDSFSGQRVYSTVAMLLLILGFFIVAKTSSASSKMLTWAFLCLLILTSLAGTIFAYAKLRTSSTPRTYINNFLIRCVVYYAGLVLLLFTIVTKYFPR